MIDTELEQVDRRLAQLTRLSTELVDALNLYHQLMRDLPAGAVPAPVPGGYPGQVGQYAPPPQAVYGSFVHGMYQSQDQHPQQQHPGMPVSSTPQAMPMQHGMPPQVS